MNAHEHRLYNSNLAAVSRYAFNSWREYIRHIQDDNSPRDEKNYIYRGQGNSQWLLQTKFSREFGDESRNPKMPHSEPDLCAEFFNKIQGLIDQSTYDKCESNEMEIFALGQHFGLSTPLLDYSKSPFVALFFALHQLGEHNGVDIKDAQISISKVHKHRIKQVTKNQIQCFESKLGVNQRLKSQQGLFLDIPSYLPALEDVLLKDSFELGNQEFLSKIDITIKDSEDKNEALNFLAKANLNYLTLFPDLTGAALEANKTFLLNYY